jgi:pimeloyl-ACP methyl ester carboxylesterase
MGRVTTTITLPRLGETMEEARIASWLVAEGTSFKRGDILLEVETDKTVVEVPALQDGTMLKHLASVGDTIALDSPIAEIETEATAQLMVTPPDREHFTRAPQPPLTPEIAAAAAINRSTVLNMVKRPPASAAARAISRHTETDLLAIKGTGRRGRISRSDVLDYLGAPPKPIVILIHGLCDQPSGWRDMPRKLRDQGHQVITPTLPGHGPESVPVFDDVAKTVEAFCEAIIAAMPAGQITIAAHSIGAVFASQLAQMLGKRVDKLILSAPAGCGETINQTFIDQMLGANSTNALADALVMLGAGPLSDIALLQELDRLAQNREDISSFAQLITSQGRQNVDIRAQLSSLDCAIAAMFGLTDQIIDWRDCTALPSTVSLHLVKGAGHLPHVAEAALFMKLVATPAQSKRALAG